MVKFFDIIEMAISDPYGFGGFDVGARMTVDGKDDFKVLFLGQGIVKVRRWFWFDTVFDIGCRLFRRFQQLAKRTRPR